MSITIKLILILISLVLFVFLRNSYMHNHLKKNWFQLNNNLNNLPHGFEIITDENGDHAGYFIWLLGPYEYRDSKDGELKWSE